MPAGVEPASGLLFERERELAVVDALLRDVKTGRGATVLVEAQAGVGKTRLLRLAAQRAGEAGFTILRGRGSELERPFGFGVVRQLLARAVAEDPRLWSAGAEAARPVLLDEAATTAAGDAAGFGTLRALEWLVGDLAARGPLAIVADDLQWADAASLRFLVLLAERLEELPLALVGAMRPREPGADQALLDALAVAAPTVLRLPALTAEATAQLVRSRLGAATDAFTAACHRATGGNPFLLGELVGELSSDGAAGTDADAERVVAFGSERVARSVRRRLRALGPEAAALARAVAVLGPAARLTDAAQLAGLGEDVAGAAADALAAVAVLASGETLDFEHPLVAASIYDSIAAHERVALHAAAAALLADGGADDERVAAHLLRVTPSGDGARVARLRAAARRAAARGAPEAAVGYLDRALQEPPAAAHLAGVLHELGLAEATDRRRDRFEAHLRAAIAATRTTDVRAAAALDLGRALAAFGDFAAAVDVLDGALREQADLESPLAVALEAELLTIALNDFTVAAPARARWERRFAELAAGARLQPPTLACLALARVTAVPPAADALGLARASLAGWQGDEPNSIVGGCIGNALLFAGALVRAGRFYDDALAAATRRGSRLTLSWQLVMRADVSLRLGDVRRAEAEARLGLELVESGSGPAAYAWTLAHLVGPLVLRGALDEADELLRRGLVDDAAPPSFALALLLCARSRLRLAQGDAVTALADARDAGRIVGAIVHNPMACAWRADAALALAALGRRDEARDLAKQELEWAHRFGVPDAIGAALRTLGSVSGGGDDDDDDATALLRESIAVLEGAEGRLEHARSTLELGMALRRDGRRGEARDVLRAALDLTARAGASALADRAHAELVTAGARPRRERRLLSGREALTAGEDRVAVLAAEGLTNREIAQRLFVTPKAVQWHLRNIYRKLDVTARTELAAALGLTGSQDETLGGGA